MSDIPQWATDLINSQVDPLLVPELSKEQKIKLARQKTDDVVRDVKEAAEAKVRALKNS